MNFNASFFERQKEEFFDTYPDLPIVAAPNKPAPSEEFRKYQQICSAGNATRLEKSLFKEAQRQHLANIDKYHEASSNHRKLYVEWSEKRKLERKEWFNSNYQLPPHFSHLNSLVDWDGEFVPQDCSYEYTELPVL